MRRKLAALCLGALLLVPACASSSPSGPAAGGGVTSPPGTGGPLTVTVPPSLSLELVTISTDAFTMDVPAGWTWETVGAYTSFGIRAFDPVAPGRQVFFYAKMEPFIRSEAARSIYRASADQTSGPSYAQMYADAPVLAPATVTQFFTEFDQYVAYAGAYGVEHSFASLADLEVVEVLPLATPIGDYTVDDAVVRGLFTTDGVPCEGLFAASVFDGGPSVVNGVDTAPLSVYNVMGIAAPAGEFAQLEEALARSLASFAYTDAYLRSAQQHLADESGAMQASAATMSSAHDSFRAARAAAPHPRG